MDLDKLILTMIGLCVTLALQAVVQLVVAMRPKNGAHAMKELIEAIGEMQRRGQEQMQSAYPPERFNRMHDRVIQVHEVVVTGDRKGAIAQIRKVEGSA